MIIISDNLKLLGDKSLGFLRVMEYDGLLFVGGRYWRTERRAYDPELLVAKYGRCFKKRAGYWSVTLTEEVIGSQVARYSTKAFVSFESIPVYHVSQHCVDRFREKFSVPEHIHTDQCLKRYLVSLVMQATEHEIPTRYKVHAINKYGIGCKYLFNYVTQTMFVVVPDTPGHLIVTTCHNNDFMERDLNVPSGRHTTSGVLPLGSGRQTKWGRGDSGERPEYRKTRSPLSPSRDAHHLNEKFQQDL